MFHVKHQAGAVTDSQCLRIGPTKGLTAAFHVKRHASTLRDSPDSIIYSRVDFATASGPSIPPFRCEGVGGSAYAGSPSSQRGWNTAYPDRRRRCRFADNSRCAAARGGFLSISVGSARHGANRGQVHGGAGSIDRQAARDRGAIRRLVDPPPASAGRVRAGDRALDISLTPVFPRCPPPLPPDRFGTRRRIPATGRM